MIFRTGHINSHRCTVHRGISKSGSCLKSRRINLYQFDHPASFPRARTPRERTFAPMLLRHYFVINDERTRVCEKRVARGKHTNACCRGDCQSMYRQTERFHDHGRTKRSSFTSRTFIRASFLPSEHFVRIRK